VTTLRQEPHVVAHSAAIQTYVGHSGGPTEEMQKRIVARDKVHKDKIGPLRCNEKGNEDVLVSNQELESVIENLAEANRKKSGIIIEVTALSFKLKCISNFKVNLFLVSFFFCRKQ
jgi:hypothetical protein